MPTDESSNPMDWYYIAQKDLKRAKLLADHSDWAGAGFYIQQSIEKYLKGYLLSNGWKLRRIHNLEALIDDATLYDESFSEYRDVSRKINRYYFEDRYPMMISSHLLEIDITESLEWAEKIKDKFDG
jgi:HEPN domain-containing protein